MNGLQEKGETGAGTGIGADDGTAGRSERPGRTKPRVERNQQKKIDAAICKS